MAELQLIIRRGPSTVIQGTRKQIAAELEKFGNGLEELTLIVPGKQVVNNEAPPLHKRKSFDEVFGPLQKGFEESGMTDDELGEFIDAEIATYRAERRTKEQSYLFPAPEVTQRVPPVFGKQAAPLQLWKFCTASGKAKATG